MGLFSIFAFGRRSRILHAPDEALEVLAEALPGFGAVDAVVSEDGHAALAITPDGRIALVQPRGARAAARAVAWPMLRQTCEGIVIETGDRRFGEVLLRGITALDMRRLGQPAMPPSVAQLVAMDELAGA